MLHVPPQPLVWLDFKVMIVEQDILTVWRKVAKSHSLFVPQITEFYQTFVDIVCSSLEMYIRMQPLLPATFSPP